MQRAIQPYRIDAPESDLEALRARLRRTRWPRDIGDNAGWAAGVSLAFMRDLVAYWLEGYDWRAREREMNALPQFKTEVDGVAIHFVHIRGKGPNPAPLIINHGWPCTFWDMRAILGPLTDPAAYGGDPADAFDVVVPSLPGVAFSSPLTWVGMNYVVTADLWVKLMGRLGYDRFAAQGGDIGALVAAQLGRKYAERLIGVHLHAPLSAQAPDLVTGDELTEGVGEEGWTQTTLTFLRDRAAYLYLQRTRPQTIAFSLHNSPSGLAAWLIDARRALGDCGDDVEAMFSKDELITNAMIYWLTDTFASSAGHFYSARPDRSELVAAAPAMCAAPTGILQFRGDVMLCPRDWAERHFNLRRWTVAAGGGRFAPVQAPHVLVEDLRAFFRPMRT